MIAIFSKFEMAGGSERRCVELANGIQRYTKHDAIILAEKRLPSSLKDLLKVEFIENVLDEPRWFYEKEGTDCVIVVNTDCKEFSKLDYWQGKTHRHDKELDLSKVRKMIFLYNFLVSPAQHLYGIAEQTDVSIAVTNSKFFNELTEQDRYERVQILPRYILGSPINPETIKTRTRKGYGFVFGCHSKGAGSKWNKDWPKLVDIIKSRYSEASFRLMGTKLEMDSATCLKENEEPVSDFLDSLDVFVFFPDYKREEPWARVIAEAMMAGLPIVALNKGGTSDQVLQWNNGFLCKKFNDYHQALVYLLEHSDIIEDMSLNSIRISRQFRTENIIHKLMEII